MPLTKTAAHATSASLPSFLAKIPEFGSCKTEAGFKTLYEMGLFVGIQHQVAVGLSMGRSQDGVISLALLA